MGKSTLKYILSIMIIVFLGINGYAQLSGTYTTNEYFYLPGYGSFGLDELAEYNLYMEKADNQIQANKEAIENLDFDGIFATKSGDETEIYCNFDTGSDETGDGTYENPYKTLQFAWDSLPDVITEYTSIALQADEVADSISLKGKAGGLVDIIGGYEDDGMWLSVEIKAGIFEANNAYLENIDFVGDEYIDVYLNNFLYGINGCSVTNGGMTVRNTESIVQCVFTESNLFIHNSNIRLESNLFEDCYNAIVVFSGTFINSGNTFINCYDEILDMAGITYNLAYDGTAIDTTGKSEGKTLIFNNEGNLIVGDMPSGNGGGATTFVGLTDTPANYTDKAGYFPKVNAGATALEFAELTESDITDFGTYLTDITAESFADLSDIPAHPGVATKILETTADGYQYIDTPSGSGGEANTASNIGGYEEIFKQKDGVDFEFRTLRAGTGIDIYNSVPTGAWDITNCSYDSISKDISSQESSPYGVAFNSDGSKMYIVGDNKTVYQYTLSTPWNVGTATYDSISVSVNSQDGYPYAVAFNSDGSKMYIVGLVNKSVFQYTLSTPWNVGTATYDTSKSVSSQDSSPCAVAFNSDGSKMYIVGYTNKTVYQYTLSTPWNVSTATYDTSKSVSSQDSSPYDVAFNSDGSKMYILGYANDTVYQYTLSTRWNVSTATYDNISKDISSQESSPRSVAFNSDGSKMYIVGTTSDTVYQYTVGGTTEYDYITVDIDIPNDSTKFLDGAGNWNTLVESDISDLGTYLENVSEDTTPQLGGDLDLNEKNIALDSTLTADHSYSGIIDVVTAGESVVFGDVLYFKSDGEWYKANAAGTGTYPGLVIALESKTDGQACKVLRMGYIRDDSWSWTVGAILLLGETAGALTATVPSDTGDMVQRLGYAIHADKIYFMPSIDVGEI